MGLCAAQIRSLPGQMVPTKSSRSPGAAVPGPILPGLECPDRLENRLGQTAPPSPSSPCRDRLGALGSASEGLASPPLALQQRSCCQPDSGQWGGSP